VKKYNPNPFAVLSNDELFMVVRSGNNLLIFTPVPKLKILQKAFKKIWDTVWGSQFKWRH